MMQYPLPCDTRSAFESGQAGCRNVGLLFGRYNPFGNNWQMEGKDKLEAFKAIANAANHGHRDNEFRLTVANYHQRWLCSVTAAGSPADCNFEADPEWRFVIGLGQDSALETGFTFHHVYGFPYLPGSALKGLTQTHALWLVAEHFGVPGILPGERIDGDTPVKMLERMLLTTDEQERQDLLERLRRSGLLPDQSRIKSQPEDQLIEDLLQHEVARNYRAVFGTQSARGRVVFFDAVPVMPPKLVVDVMNPHYGPYYQEKGKKTPPADYLSPVPVYFLAVESGSRFAFAVAARNIEGAEGAPLARLACSWMKDALNTIGVGGKTSAGYGYFKILTQISTPSLSASSAPIGVGGVPQLAIPLAESISSASIPSSTSQAAQETVVSEVWRNGVVRQYNPEQGRGRLVDSASGEEFLFQRNAIHSKAWSPGKGHKVRFVVEAAAGKIVVVKIQKL